MAYILQYSRALVSFYFILTISLVLPHVGIAEPSSFEFSDKFEIGDKYQWVIDENKNDGVAVTDGLFKEGSIVEVEVVGNVSDYNHYGFNPENQLAGIFTLKIDGSNYFLYYIYDFIVPLLYQYPNGTSENYFERQLRSDLLTDDEKILETRELDGREYVKTLTLLNSSGEERYKLTTIHDIDFGLLNLLDLRSEGFVFKIVRLMNDDDGSFLDRLPTMTFISTILVIQSLYMFYWFRRWTKS